MSAVLDLSPQLRPMGSADLDSVLAIERDLYTHPWTLGNFRDSLHAGYSCWAMLCQGELIGYGVLMVGVAEAHLLNLSIAAGWQRRGLGRLLLHHFIDIARSYGALRILLEVRPSNHAGRALYGQAGFRTMAVRRDYYPAGAGREDAIVMELEL
jgi:ribosomal-protein-alanine N-acetyltransferase